MSDAGPAVQLIEERQAADALAARLPGLLIQAERIARTIEQGVHGRKRAGVGETFWQFRPYQPGEDAKRIDWRQSAKSNDLFVREQEWEAAQSVWLDCDLSSSMGFASSDKLPKKIERAVLLTLALGMVLVQGGERITLLGSGQRPAAGNFAIDQLCSSLLAKHKRARDEFEEIVTDVPRAATIVMISDFLAPLDAVKRRIDALAGRSVRGVAIHLIDPAEAAFPYSGRVLFEDFESDGAILIRNSASIRDRYRALFEAHRRAVQSLMSQRGWTGHQHDTSKPPENALLAVYQSLAPTLAA